MWFEFRVSELQYKFRPYGILYVQLYSIENSTLVGRLRLGPSFVSRLWSRVWASETFQCCDTCRIYSANICTPFTVILTTVPVAHWANAYTMPHDQVQLLTL